MVGGRDYINSIYNRATQATRQPGSALKLFVYLSALEAGMKPTDTIVDEPVTIDGWSPRNETRTNLGPVSLREAFSRSINTVSAKIGQQVGFGTIADMARRFGITTPISTYPSMVLGTSEVRLIDMTRAFAAIADKGVAVTPYGIRKVVTADGRLLYQHEAPDNRVLVAPWVAAEMTDLLQSAVLSGTGRAAQIGRPVAGKTGTTTLNKDGWFIGFSSGLTTGVWMGRDDAKPVARPLGRNRAGARLPRFHDRGRRQPSARAVRDPGADARLAADARGGSCSGTRRSTRIASSSRWSTRTATRFRCSRLRIRRRPKPWCARTAPANPRSRNWIRRSRRRRRRASRALASRIRLNPIRLSRGHPIRQQQQPPPRSAPPPEQPQPRPYRRSSDLACARPFPNSIASRRLNAGL